MNIAEQYRDRAAACEKIAEAAISDEHRRRILEIARSWRQLADEREQMLKALADPKQNAPNSKGNVRSDRAISGRQT
jgi:hypothetical protein